MIQRQGLAFLNRYKYEELWNCLSSGTFLSVKPIQNCFFVLQYFRDRDSFTSAFCSSTESISTSWPPCLLHNLSAVYQFIGLSTNLENIFSSGRQQHNTYSNWRGAESKVKRSSPFFWIFFLTKMLGLYFKALVQPFTFSLFPERCFLSG